MLIWFTSLKGQCVFRRLRIAHCQDRVSKKRECGPLSSRKTTKHPPKKTPLLANARVLSAKELAKVLQHGFAVCFWCLPGTTVDTSHSQFKVGCLGLGLDSQRCARAARHISTLSTSPTFAPTIMTCTVAKRKKHEKARILTLVP